MIPASRENGVSQIVYSPLAQGVLTGKYRAGREAGGGDARRGATRSDVGVPSDDVLERVQRLRPIADGLGLSMAQLALAWILREPNVAAAIIGASKPEQLRDNAGASGVTLDDATLQRDRRRARLELAAETRGPLAQPHVDLVVRSRLALRDLQPCDVRVLVVRLHSGLPPTPVQSAGGIARRPRAGAEEQIGVAGVRPDR